MLQHAAFFSSHHQRHLDPVEDLFPSLRNPFSTHTNWFLSHSHFIRMVIYSIELFCILLILLFCSVLTCAVSACSSISSNSWYSSSSGSAPESRAALAMKYGGSSPMAVPAPWEKNNSDLLLCLLLNRKHVTCTALWTLHMNSTDETSCFEKSAFIHQVTFLLISNLTLFLWNSTFPLPSFSKLQLLSVQRAKSQWQTVVCKVKTTLFVHLWGLQSGALPSSGKARQPAASCAWRGGEAGAVAAAAGARGRPGALLSDTIPDSAPRCHLIPPHDARHSCQHVTACAPEQPSE